VTQGLQLGTPAGNGGSKPDRAKAVTDAPEATDS
jgi:hypothetical protein